MVKFCFLFFLTTASAYAQDSALLHPSLLLEPLSDGNYLGALHDFEAKRPHYLNSKHNDRFRVLLAYYYTFLCEYRAAVTEMDSVSWRQKHPAKDTTSLADLSLLDARQLIISLAKSRRAVFINESHHQPKHRVFIASLLDSLYSLGYRYFFSELLDPAQPSNGYPTIRFSQRSFYINEPAYADLIRRAQKIGFTILAYEDTTEGVRDIQTREWNQARNIASIFDKDPGAKIVVHAGEQHINEAEDNKKVAPMALCFRRLTGIDPLTINQSRWTENSNESFDKPLYVRLLQNLDCVKPSVPLLNGQPFLPPQDSGKFDVAILHLRTQVVGGKPDWLINAGRKLVPIAKPLYQDELLPLLVQARYVNENDDAVPLDQTLIRTDQAEYFLCLPPGNFHIRVTNAENKTVSEFMQSVK